MKSQTRATATWKEIKPFAIRDIGSMMEQAKSSNQQEGYFIILYDESGQVKREYSFSELGFMAALAASASGDVVWIPAGTIEISGSGDVEYACLTTNTKALDLGAGNSGNDPPDGWDEIDFDDSAWDNAIDSDEASAEVSPAVSLWIGDPDAGNQRAAFRHEFSIDTPFSAAELLWDGDDWTNGIYVNGTLVDEWLSHAAGDDHPARSVDVTALLNVGNNVICIDQFNARAMGGGVSWVLTITTLGSNTIPSGVEVVGLGKNSVIDGNVICNGKLTNITVTGTISGTGEYLCYDTNGLLITNKQIQSDLATGTAPLVIASTTVVSNLNADLLDGEHAAAFADAVHTHTESDIIDLDHDASKIDGIAVDLTGITDGEALVYDVYEGKIIPGEGGGGAGDMTKAVYDADADDVVDEAAAVEGVAAAGNSKYYGTDESGTPGFYDLPSGAEDTAAIHDDESGEIHAITEKTTPVDDDELLIEDSVASYAKKRLKISNLPAGGGGFSTGDIQQVELYRSTLAEAGRFDFSSIPQTYDHLIINLRAVSDVGAEVDIVYMYLNNDTTAGNYRFVPLYNTGGALNVTRTDTPTVAFVSGANATTFNYGQCIINILKYADSNQKYATWMFAERDDAAERGGMGMTHWESAAAINQITIQPDGYATDKFAAGSFCQIIGVKTVA